MIHTLVVLVADEDADRSSLFLEASTGGSDVVFFSSSTSLWTLLSLSPSNQESVQLAQLSFFLEVVQSIGVIPLIPH